MITTTPSKSSRLVRAIRDSGLSIYDSVKIGDPQLWIPTPKLQTILDKGLRGILLAGLPLRTRSKVVKESVCRVLGYPVPTSFQRTRPRFPGQGFDIYVQKSNNLQIFNEELSATRRYVMIRVSAEDLITRVKVVTGDTLALLDTTGTLTKKYQARCKPGDQRTELIVTIDTDVLAGFVSRKAMLAAPIVAPVRYPEKGGLLSIAELFNRLEKIVGKSFANAGSDQERNRGAALHKLVCAALGYSSYQDDGRFPDVRHQLLEVKLQTSPTIDLGLVCPNSIEPLDVPMISGTQIRHCDVRYAVFYAVVEKEVVTVTHFFLTTGQAFFSRFPQVQGKVLNSKLQIPLRANFFDV